MKHQPQPECKPDPDGQGMIYRAGCACGWTADHWHTNYEWTELAFDTHLAHMQEGAR